MSDQLSILDLVANDVTHADDAARIRAAILADGRAHHGRIDSNRVREALRNDDELGELDVYHKVIGAIYSALRSKGYIVRNGYIDSTDKRGGNAGKPVPAWRLTESGWNA